MEPIAAQSAAGVLRTGAVAGGSEAATVLREGQVVAGEIAKNLGDGGILVALGRQRVPAQTDLKLQVGQQFLFRVEVEHGQIVLRILGGQEAAESTFWRALRAVASQDRPVGELLGELAARVRAELAKPGAAFDALRALLSRLGGHAPAPDGEGASLRSVLLRSGLRYEAALLSAARGGVDARALDSLRGDLKAELMRAFSNLGDGPVREAVGRLLAGLEAEQLLNLARQQAGEPTVWSFPVPDGEAFSTATLLVPPPRDDEDGNAFDEEGGEPARVVLGVSFSNTGPIRVDVAHSENAISVRMLVSREDVAERLRADAETLLALLDDGQRQVHVAARVGAPEEVVVGARPLDTRVLREHHLMDVRG